MSLADIKAALAVVGAGVRPDALLSELKPPPPGALTSVIVLDRVEDVAKPDYRTHGYVQCGRCLAFCWLGHATETVVTSGEAQPVCLPCITAINDQHSIRDKLKLFDRVHDPKRHDEADT